MLRKLCKKVGKDSRLILNKSSELFAGIAQYNYTTFIELHTLRAHLYKILTDAYELNLRQLKNLNPKLKSAYNSISAHISQVVARAEDIEDQKVGTGSKSREGQ